MEEIKNNNRESKIIGNAISAYLMICVSWLFLFNKTNNNINNDFVKWHTKTAIKIHMWFFITYLIFITYSLFSGINIIWIWLNVIIADLIFLWLLWMLILWIYKAKNSLEFNISWDIHITKKHTILDLDWDWEITEKEKFTILLSYIPFIWFLNYSKYTENETINESTRLNITVSTFITLLYLFDYPNLANLFSLFYIVLIAFIWINLFTRNEFIQVKLPQIFSPAKIHFFISISIKYLKNYFNDNKFKQFSVLENEECEIIKLNEQKDIEFISTRKELRPAKFLIYIPFLNLIFIFFRDTKYIFHIINGIVITFIVIICIILSYFININNYIYLLISFPILFWIWFTSNKLEYKLPFIFDIYTFFSKIFSFLKVWSKKVNEKRKEVNEINLKVQWTIEL